MPAGATRHRLQNGYKSLQFGTIVDWKIFVLYNGNIKTLGGQTVMKKTLLTAASAAVICLTACNLQSPDMLLAEETIPVDTAIISALETSPKNPENNQVNLTFPADEDETTFEEFKNFQAELLKTAGLTEEQGKRVDYLISKMDMTGVSYSFDSPRELGLTTLRTLMREYFTMYGSGNDRMRNDMKEILTEEQLLDGFEDMFGTREIPFGYEFSDVEYRDMAVSIDGNPLTYVLQYGTQGVPEMGGISADFRTVSMERDGNLIRVQRKNRYHNEEMYFWDEPNQTFYYRKEAEEKFGGSYDFESGTKLPEGIEARCFPSFVRTMEYTLEIAADGHIFIKSGRVVE